jgi:hypothetical protein
MSVILRPKRLSFWHVFWFPQILGNMHLNQTITAAILPRVRSQYRRGSGFIIGFNEHLQLLTASEDLTALHNLQINRVRDHSLSACCVFTSSLVPSSTAEAPQHSFSFFGGQLKRQIFWCWSVNTKSIPTYYGKTHSWRTSGWELTRRTSIQADDTADKIRTHFFKDVTRDMRQSQRTLTR